MKRLRRQRPFLQSILNEANRFKRRELLEHANADQINALSEMTLNLLKKRIPIQASMLNTRDAQGYPLKGYDIVPERPKKPENNHLSELTKLLKEANQRADDFEERAHLWQKAYLDLQREHLALKYDDMCLHCKRKEVETEAGDTIELCEECSLRGATKQDLKQRLIKAHDTIRYWQKCYETVLSERFEDHDRGSHDGSNERV